jgi:hypothetical protein
MCGPVAHYLRLAWPDLITIRNLPGGGSFISCNNPVLSGFQGGCKVTVGEKDSDQRTHTQNGGRNAKLFCCF